MEKIKKSFSKKYPVLRLYKDDIEDLVNLFKNNFDEFSIKVDDYKIDNVSEIEKIEKNEITDFELSTWPPRCSLDCSDSSVRVYLSDIDDLKLSGLAANIDRILNKRKSPLRFFISNWIQLPLQIPFWLTFWLFPFKQHLTLGILIIFFIIILNVFWFWQSTRISFHKYCLVYLHDHSSSSGFLKRKKDDIFLALISAIFGGLITLLIFFLTRN